MRLRIVTLLLAALSLAIGYQSCDLVPGDAGLNASAPHLRLDGGNGEPYDGKLVDYTRYVPGFTCNGSASQHSAIAEENNIYSLKSLSKDRCQPLISSINTGELFFSPHAEPYVAHLSGIYTAASIDQGEKGIYTEAWCQLYSRSGEQSSVHLGDLVTIWDQSHEGVELKWHQNGVELVSLNTGLTRTLTRDHVAYNSVDGQLNMQIYFKVKEPSGFARMSGKFTGTLLGTEYVDENIKCFMGGEFDPAVPELSYYPDARIFPTGESDTMVPQSNRSLLNYTVTPDLPQGLVLNGSTGAISGVAVGAAPRRNYLIKAGMKYGSLSRAVELGVGEVITIGESSTCPSGRAPCSLDEAFLSTRNSPVPWVIDLPPKEQIALTGALLVESDYLIRGGGSTLDAQLGHRHFESKGKHHLHLRDLTLQNGRSASNGGSILFEGPELFELGGALFLVGVNFRNNATNEFYFSGGAIFARDTGVYIGQSTFENNRIPTGQPLSGGYGGAIAVIHPLSFDVHDSHFKGNETLSSQGGAIYLDWSQYLGEATVLRYIKNSIFEENRARDGGALYIRTGGMTLENVVFRGNEAQSKGGAVAIKSGGRIHVLNSRFEDNRAYFASGLNTEQSATVSIESSVFSGNTRGIQDPVDHRTPVIRSIESYLVQMLGNTILASDSSKDCEIRQPDWSTHRIPGWPVTGFFVLNGNNLSDRSCWEY